MIVFYNSTSMLWWLWAIVVVFKVNSLQKIQLTEVTRQPIKQSQMMSYGQVEIKNFYNFQYYCRIDVGSPKQRADVILDTGSHHLYLPAHNCTNCPYGTRKYDPSLSQTAVTYPMKCNKLSYGKGEVKGYQVLDQVTFQNSSVTVPFLAVDQQKDTENSQADGLMGLSNYKKYKNMFDVLYESGQIVSNKIAFELGVRELKQKSYFYYNLSEEDFPNAVYINASRKDYWTIPVRQMKVGNHSFDPQHALVDSGTSLILMPPALYKEFDEVVFSKFCKPAGSNLRSCACPSEVEYPNITVYSGNIAFNITPANYILGYYKDKGCKLGVESMTNHQEFMILGDLFFHHQVILFDKTNNRIGFVNQYSPVNLYPNLNAFTPITYALTAAALLATVMILGLRRGKSNLQPKSMLAESLRSGNLEMATGVDQSQ